MFELPASTIVLLPAFEKLTAPAVTALGVTGIDRRSSWSSATRERVLPATVASTRTQRRRLGVPPLSSYLQMSGPLPPSVQPVVVTSTPPGIWLPQLAAMVPL